MKRNGSTSRVAVLRWQCEAALAERVLYGPPSSFVDVSRMVDPVRQEVIALAHTVVVKVGTNVLAGSDGKLLPERVQALADQIHRLREKGRKVVLVSSGAIGAGM